MSESRRRGRIPRMVLFAIGLTLIVGVVGALALRRGRAAPERSFTLIHPRRDTLIATVNAAGQIEPAQVAELSFASTGRVSEVLVKVGDVVPRGAALARLDTRELQLRVAQAQAQLDQARASYEQLLAGATPEEIAAAEAQLEQAGGQLRQARGSVTSSDIRAAEAQLAQAQAQLAQLTAGPKTPDLQTAEAQLGQARANLQSQRDSLSAAKTSAQLRMEQAVAALTQAQSSYATAKQNWDYAQETGNDPANPTTRDPTTGASRANKLNDAQRQRYYDAYVQAEAGLHSAEAAVQQAQVAYDNARQSEVSGIQAAEEQVRSAQAALDRLLAGSDPDQIAAARAQVASARANLERLLGEQRAGALEAAQAGVAQAQANLERLRAGPQPGDLAVARAQIQGAQAALDLARLTLEEATLSAPFGGTVAEVNLKVGESPGPTAAPVVLADLSSYHVDVTVDEIDVSRLAAGQAVTLTLDALPDLALPGAIESVAPLANDQSGITAYQVRVTIAERDERVRSGMSANADIVVARKEQALLVPRRAVRNERGRLVVDLVQDQSLCAIPADQRPLELALTQREVQVGLSNDQAIEITAGLEPDACIYVEGIDVRLRPFESGGPPPGVRDQQQRR